MSYPQSALTATIANGASLSQGLYIGGRIASITLPSAWTAANLTFQASQDGATFTDVYDSAGNEVTATAAASHTITIDQFNGAIFIKIRSGTGGTPVAQGAARALTVLVERRPFTSGGLGVAN
jgi:hypothetical protein